MKIWNSPISELAATKTFPPPSIKLVIAATSSDPPNSTYEKNSNIQIWFFSIKTGKNVHVLILALYIKGYE